MLISLKPEFFCHFEHILVKGTNANFAPAVFFAYVKCSSYVNCIQTFAFRQNIIVIGYRIFKIFSNIYVKNVIQKFIEVLQSGRKPITTYFIHSVSIISSQNNICFKSEHNRTHPSFIALPNIQSFLRQRFIHQNSKQKRRIKVVYCHNLKSIGTRIFVIRPPVLTFYFGFRIKPFGSFHRLRSPLRQTCPASFGFLNHPLNKTSFFITFHRKHHPIAEVYKPIARLCRFSFLNSSSLHNRNIEKLSEAEFLNSKPKWRSI